MNRSEYYYRKLMAWFVIGCMALGPSAFLFAEQDSYGSDAVCKPAIDAQVVSNDGDSIVLDKRVPDFKNAGFVLGDKMTIAFEGKKPMHGIYSETKYMAGYHEIYVDPHSSGKVSIELRHAYFDTSLDGNVHISYAGHSDRADILANYLADKVPLEDTTDLAFCNHRMVTAGNIREGLIYRSCDPLADDGDERPALADRFAAEAGIKNEIDLCDTVSNIEKRIRSGALDGSPYCTELYRNGGVLLLDRTMSSSLFNNTAQFKVCFEYMLENDGPFLIHCHEGKDRAGLFCILLEGICGASLEEVRADHMQSMVNYFNLVPGSEEYMMVQSMICDHVIYMLAHYKLFSDAAYIDWDKADISKVDIRKACVDYMVEECGLTHEQVDRLAAKLTA